MQQGRLLLHARPDGLDAIAAGEMTDTGESEIKPRRTDTRESCIDIIHVAAIDIAEETQRDVKILRRDPAGAGESPTEKPQLPAHSFREAQGNEESHQMNAAGECRADESPLAGPIIHKSGA